MTFTAISQSLAASAATAIPAPVWSGFNVGPLRIHAYALCILLGIVASIWLTNIRWRRRGGPEGSIWDIAIWAIPFGIIGGRLYHVFSSPDAYFGPGYNGTGDLWLIPQIWRGGLGIWGAVVLGVLGAWIGCRRAGVRISAFIDAAAPGILLAQAIGRWGNYFNQELFGGPTTLPWGLHVDPQYVPAGFSPDTLFHPTFLYECVWDVLGVVALLLIDRRFRLRRGRMFLMYAMVYTAGRLWIEMLRIDAAEHITFFGITARLNVWTSIFVFTAALIVFLLLTFIRRKSVTHSVFLPGRGPAAAVAGGVSTETDMGARAKGFQEKGARDTDAPDKAAPEKAAPKNGEGTGGAATADAPDQDSGARHAGPTATDDAALPTTGGAADDTAPGADRPTAKDAATPEETGKSGH
ncbi:prolipoprotein diacylglyceryl transferase [Arthrobacter sp. STN4]|uniref:prolipoprotein diacylglyceryl transferase n=1 Tax=Arthrobacter sp. STN4 TaxID=2923276 RepID=UPI00211A21A2|nr:prolipoprotein diacylglyceryl transferase [Arthrobacter sp. STN4]MCQ9164023.1 prolipoprotein diacylglyceryl transferase [Arthrobacter sp. STN4]